MEILEKMFYGLILGLSELLPVSSLAHRRIFTMLTGMEEGPVWLLMAHIGVLAALLVHYSRQLRHMQREMQIAGAKKHRRLRQPDMAAVSDSRIILTACVPFAAALIFGRLIPGYVRELWVMALLLLVNGLILYLPQYSPDGIRGSVSMSPADGFLFGLCGIASYVPGLSRVAAVLFAANRRSVERAYSLELALLMSIPWIAGLLVLDVIGLFSAAFSISLLNLLGAVLCGSAAFGGAYGAVALLRYLAVRIGFHGFAYYSWGVGFACFILYLMI